MSDNGRPVDPSEDRRPETSGYATGEDIRESLRAVREFIDRARQHHAQTGEWPPDPLLDEVNEMRRRVEAEHGNDPRKVLEWYIQAGNEKMARDGASHAENSVPLA